MITHSVVPGPLFETVCGIKTTLNTQVAAHGDTPTCGTCRKDFFTTGVTHHLTDGHLSCEPSRTLANLTGRERWTGKASETSCVSCRKAMGLSPGSKHDRGKGRYDLVPTVAEELVVEVLTYGADKYGVDNWRSLDDWERRFYAAMRRHLAAWLRGEKLDPESGLPHLAHAATNCLFMLEMAEQPKQFAAAAATTPQSAGGGGTQFICAGCTHPKHAGPQSCSRRDCDCEGTKDA